LLTFTLDTNCIIAVEEARSEASSILQLASAHRSGLASVGVVAISASERQKDGGNLKNFAEFKQKLSWLGLGDLVLLEPMMYWGVTYWDFGLLSDDKMVSLERENPSHPFPKHSVLVD